ncbi:MAG: hypothetical protein ACYC6F_07720 [Longimicrobiales bacterium]
MAISIDPDRREQLLQAVQDARKYMQERLDDLDGEVHVPEANQR